MTAASITLVGNLTADPELRFTPSGAAVVNFTIACNRSKKNEQTQEWENTDESFWRCTAWREFAENIAESLTKGMGVIAQGTVAQKTYETKEGEKRNYMEVQVWSIGPDLKRCTAKVNRTSRGGGSGGPALAEGGDPWSTGARSSAAADDPWATQNDEPPF